MRIVWAKVTGSVLGKTDILIVGKAPGKKQNNNSNELTLVCVFVVVLFLSFLLPLILKLPPDTFQSAPACHYPINYHLNVSRSLFYPGASKVSQAREKNVQMMNLRDLQVTLLLRGYTYRYHHHDHFIDFFLQLTIYHIV